MRSPLRHLDLLSFKHWAAVGAGSTAWALYHLKYRPQRHDARDTETKRWTESCEDSTWELKMFKQQIASVFPYHSSPSLSRSSSPSLSPSYPTSSYIITIMLSITLTTFITLSPQTTILNIDTISTPRHQQPPSSPWSTHHILPIRLGQVPPTQRCFPGEWKQRWMASLTDRSANHAGTLVHMTYKSKVNSKHDPAETGSHSVDAGNLYQTSSLHRWLVQVWISLIPVTQHLFTEHGHLGLISIPKLFWKNRRRMGQYSVNSYCQLHAALHQNWTNEGAW